MASSFKPGIGQERERERDREADRERERESMRFVIAQSNTCALEKTERR